MESEKLKIYQNRLKVSDLINDVLKNYEVPDNKKYVAGYSYSQEITEAYKKSLQETVA